MRVLVAPDKFRGTLTAREAAEAFASGWLDGRPGDEVDLAPMADGGEGTMEALVDALGGEIVSARVGGPLGDAVDAAYGLVSASGARTAVVEMARASGSELLSPSRLDPKRTTTRGTGELIAAALDREPSQLVVGIGGSATNDGGVGMAQALGTRLLDGSGEEVGPGGEALLDIRRIDVGGLDPRLRSVTINVASDVDNPLTGPSGASAVFGPQKGASPDDVLLLDRALAHLASVVHHDLGLDLRDEPGAGAAGGLGFGLMAFLGARLRPGVEIVADAVGLADRMVRADLAITGEGRFDHQSMRGKVPAGVLDVARQARVPAVIVCGDAPEGAAPAGVPVFSLSDRFGLETALGAAGRSLQRLARELAGRAEELAEAGVS